MQPSADQERDATLENARPQPELAQEGRSPRIVRFPAVNAMTALSRSTIWRLERDGLFPKRRQLSARACGWIVDEIEQWIRER